MFMFGGKTGETPESLARKRQIADALAGRIGRAQNWGQGLGDVFAGIGAGISRYQANKSEGGERARAGVESDGFTSDIASLLAPKTQAPQVSGGTAFPNPAALPSQAPQKQPQQEFGGYGGIPSSKSVIADALMGKSTSVKDGIAATAKSLGIDPVDLATAISYETGGTFNPTKKGPRTQWGQHQGLIQFGEPQAKKYGVNWSDPVGSQLGENGAIAKYLRDTGVKPGMGMMDVYSAINAGRVGRYNASDANNGGAAGTVADKVGQQMAGHRAKAMAMFGGGTTQPPVQQAGQYALPEGAENWPEENKKFYQGLMGQDNQPVQVASNDAQGAFAAPASAPAQDVSQETMQPAPQQIAQAQPQQQASPEMLQRAMQIVRNPWSDDASKSMAQHFINQAMQQNDPAYQLKMQGDQIGLEKSRLELDAMRNPQVDPMKKVQLEQERIKLQQMQNPAPESTPDIVNYEYAVKNGFKGSPVDFEMAKRKASAINVNNNIGSEVGTIPQGYELFTDPKTGGRTMRPIAGSEAASQVEAAASAKTSRAETQQLTNDIISEDIDRAIATIDNESWYNPATGFTGGALSGTGGTNAHQLSNLIDTVGANISFDRLQQMRAESPTGGALGQVTVPELKLLQATKGAIVQSQNAEELKYNLNRLWNVQQDTVHGKGRGPKRRELKRPTDAPRPDYSNLPKGAVDDLRSDPSPESQAMFDEIFGAGSAKRALGGQ